MDEFKSPMKLPGGGEIQRCYYPFKLDTYGRGCTNNCHYCYARSVLSFRHMWDSDQPAIADYAKIEKIFEDVLIKHKKTKYSELINARIPIRLGGMTDCFASNEINNGITLKVLELLKRYQYPYLILTKSALLASKSYLMALDPDLAYIQYTITTPFDDISRRFEPGADVTSDRLYSCQKLVDEGFYVAARLNPLFPKYPDGWYSQKRDLNDDNIKMRFRYFDWCLIDLFGAANIQTVICGFVRLSSWNIRWIRESTGVDLSYLFDPAMKQSNQALHFSTSEKRYYYENIRNMCKQHGMDFTVCYDGDDAYEEFRYLWANQNDCCNGTGHIPGFTTSWDAFRRP